MADFVLYSYFRSSASYRVRIALHLKKVPFEYRPVHLLNHGGEQHSVDYMSLNPSREVPTLIHKGQVLAQSMAILEYLDEVGTEPKLFPKDPVARAKVRQFCEVINCLQPMQNLRTVQYLSDEIKATEAQKQAWLDRWLGRGFEALEALLTKNAGTYSFGSEVSAADCFLAPQIFAAKRFNIKLERFERCLTVLENLEKLEAFKKAHPLNQPDTPAN